MYNQDMFLIGIFPYSPKKSTAKVVLEGFCEFFLVTMSKGKGIINSKTMSCIEFKVLYQ